MARQIHVSKGIEKVVRYARAHDWRVTRTRNGHLRMFKPGCGIVFTSSTPSDGYRASRNAISQLRRAERNAQELH